MAENDNPNTLTSTGRTNLERPPKPTTPPEAAPRMALLAPKGTEEEANPASIGSLQQAGLIFQTGMAVEKGLLALANLLPGFAPVVQQIIPQVRQGIQIGLRQGSSQEGGPAPAGGEELPQTAVSPLQQG
jgi:hypothetical protein